MSDNELMTANRLLLPFVEKMGEALGERTQPVLINVLASQLAHHLADPKIGFPVLCIVNYWLRMVAEAHNKPPAAIDPSQRSASRSRRSGTLVVR
jgi:hypothetical protein